MKIYRIAQFSRGDQISQRLYDKHMDAVMRRDIVIAVLRFFHYLKSPKVELMPKFNKESSLVELVIKITLLDVWQGSSAQKKLKENINNLKEEIKVICGVYPKLEIWGTEPPPPPPPLKVPKSEYEKIKKMYYERDRTKDDLELFREIAKKYDVGPGLISNIVHGGF